MAVAQGDFASTNSHQVRPLDPQIVDEWATSSALSRSSADGRYSAVRPCALQIHGNQPAFPCEAAACEAEHVVEPTRRAAGINGLPVP